MSYNKYIHTFILLFTAYSFGFAQQPFTLHEYRELAINNNKALKIASEQEKIAFYNKKEALSKFFPEVQFLGGYIHNQKNLHLISSSAIPSSIPLPIPLGSVSSLPIPQTMRESILKAGEVDIQNIWAGGINLVQPIFLGGRIIAYHDLRAYAEALAQSMKETELTNVIIEVDNAYWQVVSITHKKKLAQSYLTLMQAMDNDIAAMEAEGVATKADRLAVQVKLNEAEMALTKAENGLSLAKMLLCQICGLEINSNISVADETLNLPNQQLSDNNSTPNITEALNNRSEIKSLTLATKMLEKKEKIIKADFTPQVALTANYFWSNPNLFDGFEKKFAGMWNIGVVMKMPLNFFSTSTKLNAAKAETRIKKLELEEAKEKITLQVNQSAYKLNEAYKKLKATEKNSEKANENLRYANIGFKEGVIPASEVIAAHTAWLSAHAENIDAQIDIILSKTYLNQALGRNLAD